jgi:hypothetical protein
MEYNFKKGDIVGTLGYHPISVAIQWATRSKNEGETFSNHNEIIVNNCNRLDEVFTVAALGRGVVEHNLCKTYGGRRDQVEIWRALNFSGKDRDLIAETAKSFVGRKYPWHRLFGQLIDEKIFRGRYIFRRFVFSRNYFVCTPLVVASIWAAGYNFGFQNPTEANPDNLRDYLSAPENRDKYICIRPLARIECQETP